MHQKALVLEENRTNFSQRLHLKNKMNTVKAETAFVIEELRQTVHRLSVGLLLLPAASPYRILMLQLV